MSKKKKVTAVVTTAKEKAQSTRERLAQIVAPKPKKVTHKKSK